MTNVNTHRKGQVATKKSACPSQMMGSGSFGFALPAEALREGGPRSIVSTSTERKMLLSMGGETMSRSF